MWCDLKNTEYGKRLANQLGEKNAKEFAMGIETPKFQSWFGNGKTVPIRLRTTEVMETETVFKDPSKFTQEDFESLRDSGYDTDAILDKLAEGKSKTALTQISRNLTVPFVNPIMQIINEKGTTYSLLERYKFDTIHDVNAFLSTIYTPGITQTDDYTYIIEKDDNKYINQRLLQEIDRIYPDLLIREGDAFAVDKNYKFTQNKLFAKNDDLLNQALALAENVEGLYKTILQNNTEQALYEISSQASGTVTEIKTAMRMFGEDLVNIAQQLFPDAKTGQSYEDYVQEKASKDFNTVDTKVKTLLDKLSARFDVPYSMVYAPKGEASYYNQSNGTVVINMAKFRPDIPFHEFLHPFIIILENQNPELYKTLVNELKSSKEGLETIQEVNVKYADMTEGLRMHESIVTYLGKQAEKKATNTPAITRFLKWLKSLFKKININIKELSLNTTLSDISDFMIDDVYVADLRGAARNAEAVKRYAKVDTKLTYNEIFDRIKDRIAILNATIRNRGKGDQFKEDIAALNNIIENADEITSINNFMANSLAYVDSAYNRFEFLRSSVKDSANLSKDEIAYNLYVLGEIQQLLNVYETLDDVRLLYVREGVKSTDDNMLKLAEAIDKKNLIVEDFKEFSLTYLTEWLYPYVEQTNKMVLAQGLKTGQDAALTKEKFRQSLEMAQRDIGAAGYWLGATINSRDPISAAIGLALKDVVYENHIKDLVTQKELTTAYDKVRGTQIYNTKSSEEEFNLQFLKEVEVWEETGVDAEGNPSYGYVNHLAFHEEYNNDQFDKAKRELYKELGPKPSRQNLKAFKDWQKKQAKWYAENTTIDPKVQDLIAEKKRNLSKREYERWLIGNTREIDEEVYDAGYKKSDFFRGKIYSYNQARGTFRIYAGELVKPTAKYKNKEFDKMMKDDYYRTLYNAYKRHNDKLGNFGLKYGIIPQVSKGKNLFSDLSWKKSAKENLKQVKSNLGKSVKTEYDPSRTVQRQDGTEVKKIPIKFTRRLDRNDLVVNLLENVLQFSQMANHYQGMTEIEPNLLILKTILNGDFNLGIEGRKVAKTTSKGAHLINAITKKIVPKMASEDQLKARLNEFINDIVYGDDVIQDSFNFLGHEISYNKIADKVGLLTALQNMALNFTGGINNVILGNFNNSIEAVGGRFFTKKDLLWAQGTYAANIHEFLGEIGGLTKSDINDMADHYSVPQGEFQDQFGKSLTGGQVNKMFKLSSVFFVQNATEHEIQITGLLSMMHNTKVKRKSDGKEQNLYEAWKDAKGNFNQLKLDTDWSDARDVQFRNTLHALTKNLQGIYNKFDKAVLQRRWYGKLALMFRKYMFSSFKARYGGMYIDYELGTVQEGYWNTFAKKMLNEVKDYKFGMIQNMWKKEGYSEAEKAAVNKTLYELAVIIAAFILAGMADEDDDKSWLEAEAALQVTRMSADITQFISPSDFLRVIRNPAAATNMIEKWIGWFSQLAHADEVYERATGIAEKGDNKLYIKTLKIFPGVRGVVNFMTPEEQQKFYQLTGKQ